MPVVLKEGTREGLTAVDFVKGLLEKDFVREYESCTPAKSRDYTEDSESDTSTETVKFKDFVKEYESDIHTAFVSLYSEYKDLYPNEVVDEFEIIFNPRQFLDLTRFLVNKCVKTLKKKGVLRLSIDSLRDAYSDFFNSGKTDSIFFKQSFEGYEDAIPVLAGDISKPCKSEHLMVRAAGDGICIEADIFTILTVPDAVISRLLPQYKICFMVLKALTKKALYNSINPQLRLGFSVTILEREKTPYSEVEYHVPIDLWCTDEKQYKDRLKEIREDLKDTPEFLVALGDYNLMTSINQFISLLDAMLSYE